MRATKAKFCAHMKYALTLPMVAFGALGLGLTLGPGVVEAKPKAPPTPSRQQWADYWNQGKAELTHYSLQQARYGKMHEGRAVLVFVTEPFSRKKQVKLDTVVGAGDDAVEVLKLNHTRKFNTGIYPYSTMLSVFTPSVDGGKPAYKSTTSIQEWCGHVFMQLNRRGEQYTGIALSYFESEGDKSLSVYPGTLLEDDMWNLARINPQRLPVGDVQMLPGTLYVNLLHVPVEAQTAKATLTHKGDHWFYEIRYPSLGRTLRIELEAAFPYRIVGWTEEVASGFGPGRRKLTTVAKRESTLMTAYWRQNRPEDRGLREKLGLPRDY